MKCYAKSPSFSVWNTNGHTSMKDAYCSHKSKFHQIQQTKHTYVASSCKVSARFIQLEKK